MNYYRSISNAMHRNKKRCIWNRQNEASSARRPGILGLDKKLLSSFLTASHTTWTGQQRATREPSDTTWSHTQIMVAFSSVSSGVLKKTRNKKFLSKKKEWEKSRRSFYWDNSINIRLLGIFKWTNLGEFHFSIMLHACLIPDIRNACVWYS
jgi:hypothetical protein